MTMNRVLPVLCGLLLTACGSKPLSVPAKPDPGLQVVTVGQADAAAGPGWDGVVEAVKQAVISAQTSGRVASLHVEVNDHVAAGAVLLRLTGVEQKAGLDAAQAQLKAAEAVLAETESRHRRASELVAKQLLSKADYDVTRAARDSALAARDAARAMVQQAGQAAEYTVVRAPYAGVVSARRVEAGEAVSPGQPLFGFYAPGALRVEVQLPQSVAAQVRAQPKARLVFAEGRAVDGGTVTVFPSADPNSHTVTARVALPQMASAPEPGVTAKVIFPAGGAVGPGLRSVPLSALVQRGEVSAVYVVAEARVSLRQLRVGARHADSVDVVSGLEAGEKVATDPVAASQWLARQQAGGHD
jgi:RND family efflux transporter MFP subunit